jgi:hypothetical protein
MRHETISKARIAAAAWPTTMDGLVLAEPREVQAIAGTNEDETCMPAAAAPDVAAGVGIAIVGSYVALILVFFAFFAGSLLAAFVITIAAGFVAIFFTIPRIFFGLELDRSRRPSFSAFMHQGMETLTGHSSGAAALVQMVIVPVLLTLGLLAMGIAGKIYL